MKSEKNDSSEVARPDGHWAKEAAELYDMNTVAQELMGDL